jgi:hypothetical protein
LVAACTGTDLIAALAEIILTARHPRPLRLVINRVRIAPKARHALFELL